MSQSTLRRVLTIFETGQPLTLTQIARELAVSPAQLEDMIGYWIRKGRIRQSAALSNCGSCGHTDGCPFVFDLPRSYELVTADSVPLTMISVQCEYKK